MQDLSTGQTTDFDLIFIADDDVDDQDLIKEALFDNKLANEQIQWANDGQELIQALNNASKLPNLIILDLNMPRKDGREALNEIKQHERYRYIPVIMFSTSHDAIDIRDAYELGSNTYICKPSGYQELVDTMGDIIRYWGLRAQTVQA